MWAFNKKIKTSQLEPEGRTMLCLTPFLDSHSIIQSTWIMPDGQKIEFDLHPIATNVGFAGTRWGMTAEQKAVLSSLLQAAGGEFHHGDSLGAAAEAREIAKSRNLKSIVHAASHPKQNAAEAAEKGF